MLLTLLAAALAAPATPEPVASPSITVIAPRLPEAQVRETARAYVRSVLPIPVQGQYARWLTPVCIKVAGLDDAMSARVGGRIAATATAAGVRLAGAGCRPNLLVMFSADARRDVALIVGKKPLGTRGLTRAQRELLLTAPLPVRWWQATAAGGSDGAGLNGQASATATAQFLDSSSSGVGVGGPSGSGTNSYNSSLIDTHLSVGITYAAAAIDVPLTTGRSLDAVADYAAMVTLAPIAIDAPVPAAPSILGLFAGTGTMMTDWDRAWLAALYRMTPNRRADRQRGELVEAMTKTVAR